MKERITININFTKSLVTCMKLPQSECMVKISHIVLCSSPLKGIFPSRGLGGGIPPEATLSQDLESGPAF